MNQVLCNETVYQVGCLSVFLRRLLQPSVRRPNSPVALVHEREYVGLVLRLETREYGVVRVCFARGEEFRLQAFGV